MGLGNAVKRLSTFQAAGIFFFTQGRGRLTAPVWPWALRISGPSGRLCLPSNKVGLCSSGTTQDSEKVWTRKILQFLRVAQALAIVSELNLIATRGSLTQYMIGVV